MRVTGLGHAGLRVDTAGGSVLVDPWTTPAYLGAWTPFPDNAHLDWSALCRADYLFVSSLAPDRLDAELLDRHVDRDITVLLPDTPTGELHERLRGLGFHRFLPAPDGERLRRDGLELVVWTLATPLDGPFGTSMLRLADATGTVLDQHGARPDDLGAVRALGPVDVHLLQFSQPHWSPTAYDLPERSRLLMAADVREQQFAGALASVSELAARCVVPVGGPPAFLDERLWRWNTLAEDSESVHLGQAEVRDRLRDAGHGGVRLLLPGSVLDTADGTVVTPPAAEAALADKAGHLRAQRARRGAWRPPEPLPVRDPVAELREWWGPLLHAAPLLCDGIGAAVRLTAGHIDVVIDFPGREVRPYADERVRYAFSVDRAVIEDLVGRREVDWVHTLLLSGRFRVQRLGRENPLVFLFLQSLSAPRLRLVEAWLDRRSGGGADVTVEGWTFQRDCPHQGADLSRFADIDEGVLTCRMHGWRWRLADGRCLNVAGANIRSGPSAGQRP